MRLLTPALATILLIGSAELAFADRPGADWISADQAKEKLMAAGYSNVTKIEADDGRWEGTGVKNGQVHKFHVDPHSGQITRDEVDR